MTGEDIKALRKELACTAKELAAAIGLDQATVMAWEKADLFPTKANIVRMEALRAKGPNAIVRKAKATVAVATVASAPVNPFDALAEPLVWELLRKIAAHKPLRDEVAKLAASYADPAARD